MKNIKLKKTNNGENILGYENIEIIDRILVTEVQGEFMWGEEFKSAKHFVYEYLAIADGSIITIHDNDWNAIELCYEVIT